MLQYLKEPSLLILGKYKSDKLILSNPRLIENEIDPLTRNYLSKRNQIQEDLLNRLMIL